MNKSNSALLERLECSDFDIFSCLDCLRKFPTDIGIQFCLVNKLRSYKYDEIEFLIPQLLQILVAFETESMALEEFILEYCERFPHYSLIVFWNLQAFVFELKDNPESYSFRVVKNLINHLQDILFNPNSQTRYEFRENLQPALMLSGVLAASLAIPDIGKYALPLILAQAKQKKSFVFKLANFQKTLTQNLTMKNQSMSAELRTAHSDDEESHRVVKHSLHERYSESSTRLKRHSTLTLASEDSELYTSDDEESGSMRRSAGKLNLPKNSEDFFRLYDASNHFDVSHLLKRNTAFQQKPQARTNSHSMPDLSLPKIDVPNAYQKSSINASLSDLELKKPVTGSKSPFHPAKQLRANYSKNVTDFVLALQNISLRLSQLPKEARLSALRAELSILNDSILPSEIDIPRLLPSSSTSKKYHKILRLSIKEACVLNSAERVPFLLFVEYLSDEFDFNPLATNNQAILKALDPSRKSNVDSTDSAAVTSVRQVLSDLPLVEEDLGEVNLYLTRSSSGDMSFLRRERYKIELVDRELEQRHLHTDSHAKKRADQMRIASVMLQQLEITGQANSEQSAAIKQRIVKSMIDLQDQFDDIDFDKYNELKADEATAGERKLENDFKLAEDWSAKRQRIRQASAYGHLPNWDLFSVIAKNGDDLPQEALACQLIAMISNIWAKKGVPFWTKRMKILITSANAGLVETITNAISIHSIKKSLTEISIADGDNVRRRIFTLKDYFNKLFGDAGNPAYKRAQENFARSLASYSIICYVLQIKDRHNGNIMLDNEGHIIHIDFGFLLSNSPGSVGFEAAPFKLTLEYVDLLGGAESDLFQYFKVICRDCFLSLREDSQQIIDMVEIMQKDSSLPCFNNGANTSVLLKQRLQLGLSEKDAENFVEANLIGKSLGSMYTRLYDQFQLITQGIYN